MKINARAQPRTASPVASAAARVLERNSWFASLRSVVKQELLRRSTIKNFASRALVYAAGSPPSGLYFVISGEVRLEHVAKSGKFAFYQALRASDIFGLLSEMDNSSRFSDARAWGNTTLLHLPHEECQLLNRHDPVAHQAFVALLCKQLHSALDMLVEEHSVPPRQQIANLLVAVFSRAAQDGEEMPGLTQESMAAMAGVSRPTVSKVLHEFRALGLIGMQYGKVALLDSKALQAIARARNV